MDLLGFRVLKTLTAGRGPGAVAVAPSAEPRLRLECRGRSVSMVDRIRRRVLRTVHAIAPVGGIAVSADGTRAIVAPGPALAKGVRARHPAPALREADLRRARARRAVAFSPAGARIYFANGGSGTITFASGYTFRRLPGQRARRRGGSSRWRSSRATR